MSSIDPVLVSFKGPWALLLGLQSAFSTVALFSAIADGLLRTVSPSKKAHLDAHSFG